MHSIQNPILFKPLNAELSENFFEPHQSLSSTTTIELLEGRNPHSKRSKVVQTIEHRTSCSRCMARVAIRQVAE